MKLEKNTPLPIIKISGPALNNLALNIKSKTKIKLAKTDTNKTYANLCSSMNMIPQQLQITLSQQIIKSSLSKSNNLVKYNENKSLSLSGRNFQIIKRKSKFLKSNDPQLYLLESEKRIKIMKEKLNITNRQIKWLSMCKLRSAKGTKNLSSYREEIR